MIKKITEYFRKRALRKARIKAKLDSVLADYDKLLVAYQQIEENPSRFSKKQKFKIKSRVLFLISKGHIVVNSKP